MSNFVAHATSVFYHIDHLHLILNLLSVLVAVYLKLNFMPIVPYKVITRPVLFQKLKEGRP
jgi:hypothetical protein